MPIVIPTFTATTSGSRQPFALIGECARRAARQMDNDGISAYNMNNCKDERNPMTFATVTSKGQTTIPKFVRTAANLKPGDRIHFSVLEDGTIIMRVKNRSIKDISIKPPTGKRVSIAQMNR